MDTYALWVDLKDSSRDLEFADALHAFLTALTNAGSISGYTLERRKLGFAPEGLGEFHVRIQVQDLNQLDTAFRQTARRAEPFESLHVSMFREVKNLRVALYREFPDEFRKR